MKQLTHGSLFSGIGGFELAAERAGIKNIWNCEIEEYCREVLKKNFPVTKQYTDITTLKNPGYVDIISGGFPCQDISLLNTNGKGIEGKKSGLWSEMFRIIREVKPKYVLIENSNVLLRRGFEQVLCDLSEIGYNAEWECLQAGSFGFNHKRDRAFVIAYTDKVGRSNAGLVSGKASAERGKVQAERDEAFQFFEQASCDEFIKEGKKTFYRMPQSQFCRMDDGVPKKLDRVKALGNAVVPLVVQYLFERIKQFDALSGKDKNIPSGLEDRAKDFEVSLRAWELEDQLNKLVA